MGTILFLVGIVIGMGIGISLGVAIATFKEVIDESKGGN